MCQAFPIHCLIKCSKIKGTYHQHPTLPSGSGSSEVMCLKSLQWYLQSQDLKQAWLVPSAHAFSRHPVKQPEGKGRVGSAALRASGGGRELNLLGLCGHRCPHQPGMEGCSPFTKDSCCFSTSSWKKLQAATECAVETPLGTQFPSEYVSQQHFVFSNCWLDDQGSFPLLLEKIKSTLKEMFWSFPHFCYSSDPYRNPSDGLCLHWNWFHTETKARSVLWIVQVMCCWTRMVGV